MAFSRRMVMVVSMVASARDVNFLAPQLESDAVAVVGYGNLNRLVTCDSLLCRYNIIDDAMLHDHRQRGMNGCSR